jgi:hypothetical protein
VYDTILPQSIAYRPPSAATTTGLPRPQWGLPPESTYVMPLVLFLRESTSKEAGWHRNAERQARGIHPVASISMQLEPWERQLVS